MLSVLKLIRLRPAYQFSDAWSLIEDVGAYHDRYETMWNCFITTIGTRSNYWEEILIKRGHSNVLHKQSSVEWQTENQLLCVCVCACMCVGGERVPVHSRSLFIMYAMISWWREGRLASNKAPSLPCRWRCFCSSAQIYHKERGRDKPCVCVCVCWFRGNSTSAALEILTPSGTAMVNYNMGPFISWCRPSVITRMLLLVTASVYSLSWVLGTSQQEKTIWMAKLSTKSHPFI